VKPVAQRSFPWSGRGSGDRPARPVGPEPSAAELIPEDLLRTQRHGDPLMRRLDSRMRELGSSASRDVRIMVSLSEQLTQPVSTGRRIAVLSIRGGAGKSTVSSLIGAALAAHRRDRVLAVDADPDQGSLALRLGASSHTPVRALGAQPPVLRDIADAERYLGRAAGRVWVLTGGLRDGDPERLDVGTYRAALAAVGRFFAVTITDAGGELLSPLNRGVLADTQALVLVTPATVDGVISAGQALDRLVELTGPDLPGRTVIVLTAVSPEASALDLTLATSALGRSGAEVVLLPFDRHLATGSTIDPYLLGSETRSAALKFAAAALTRAARR
jgi:MinD-like ATPase involved in chromosome partitioning or flagellar assembly